MLDIFNNDAFTVTSLTDAMREIKYVPSYISSLGLFTVTPIDTLDVAIEKDAAQQYSIVPASPRGGVGDMVGRTRRSMRRLSVPHFQRDDAMYADEVQSVRAFGTKDQVETLQRKIAVRAAEHSQSFALTEEYHRLAVITRGQLLDKDGSVLYDYFTEMGEAQPTEIDWDLDNANLSIEQLRQKSADLYRALGATLDGLPLRGVLAICGDAFYDALVNNKVVNDLMKGFDAALTLRTGFLGTDNPQDGTWGAVNLFNITWVNYRGALGVSIDSDKCKFVPLGVPGLFRTVYAPADYIETVNTMGQRLYAKQWRMPNDKGVQMEFQTNALHYVTRPRVLMSGRRT